MSTFWFSWKVVSAIISLEVGGTLIEKNGLVVVTGAESVEWYQIHQTHCFQLFDVIPFAPFWPLL
jgi:hypothetical protein